MIQGQTAMATTENIPQELIAWIDDPRRSSFDIQRRYASDKVFRDQYDALAAQRLRERIDQAERPDETLTPEIWRAMPFAEAQKRYRRDRRFKAAVDKLSAEGKI
jgi:hypothetical protein